MIRKIHALLCAAIVSFSVAAPAKAAVLYSWVRTIGPFYAAVDASFAFTDEVVASGGPYRLRCHNFTCFDTEPEGAPPPLLMPAIFGGMFWFAPDLSVSGFLYALNSGATEELRIQWNGTDWIGFIGSDNPNNGCPCEVAGYFVVTVSEPPSSAIAQVPEPPTWPLFTMGALAMMALATRQRRQAVTFVIE